jgi:hypothetical protein
MTYVTLQQYFPNVFAGRPFWLQKTTTDPDILADVNTECPDDTFPKPDICVSELMLIDRNAYRQHTA